MVIKPRHVIGCIFILVLANVLALPDFSHRQNHQIEIVDLIIPETARSCEASIPIMVHVQNTGKFEENLVLIVREEHTGQEELVQIPRFPRDRMEIMTLVFSYDKPPQGQREFHAIATFNQQTTHFFKTFAFICEEKPHTTIVANERGLPPQKPVEQPSEARISAMALGTITLAALILLLIIVYILKVYLEK